MDELELSLLETLATDSLRAAENHPPITFHNTPEADQKEIRAALERGKEQDRLTLELCGEVRAQAAEIARLRADNATLATQARQSGVRALDAECRLRDRELTDDDRYHGYRLADLEQAYLEADREYRRALAREEDLRALLHLYRKRRAVDGCKDRPYEAIPYSFAEEALQEAGEPTLPGPDYRNVPPLQGDETVEGWWRAWLAEGRDG